MFARQTTTVSARGALRARVRCSATPPRAEDIAKSMGKGRLRRVGNRYIGAQGVWFTRRSGVRTRVRNVHDHSALPLARRACAGHQSYASEPRLFAELAKQFPDGIPERRPVEELFTAQEFVIVCGYGGGSQAYRETSEFVSQEAQGSDSFRSAQEGQPGMTPHPTARTKPSAKNARITNIRLQLVDDERVVHRFEFPGGGFVEIKVSAWTLMPS